MRVDLKADAGGRALDDLFNTILKSRAESIQAPHTKRDYYKDHHKVFTEWHDRSMADDKC